MRKFDTIEGDHDCLRIFYHLVYKALTSPLPSLVDNYTKTT